MPKAGIAARATVIADKLKTVNSEVIFSNGPDEAVPIKRNRMKMGVMMPFVLPMNFSSTSLIIMVLKSICMNAIMKAVMNLIDAVKIKEVDSTSITVERANNKNVPTNVTLT